MKYYLIFFLFLFTMCSSDELPAQKFEGNFSGNNSGITSTASLTVKNNQLSGTVIMNEQPGQVSGTVTDSTSSGTVYDAVMQKSYAYTGKVSGNELRISIVFPELNNQAIELIMQRDAASKSVSKNTASSKSNGAKNQALVGVWKHTEVLSSGSGDNYASFSTEYFMEFKADGTMLSWTGRSAGSGYYGDGQNSANADKGEWYTEGKSLFLVDPVTKQKVSTLFYVEQARMMLHNGGAEKKIFERVQ